MKSNQIGSKTAWVIICLGVAFFVALALYNHFNPAPREYKNTAWNKAMTIGDTNAKHNMVKYTDPFCSFCTEMHEQTKTDKFKKDYIDSGKLHYEERVVTLLEEKSPNTVQGAHASFCAADQNKYWEFSDDLITRVKADFFDKGIGVKNVAVPKEIPLQDLKYFSQSAEKAGMDVSKFNDCVKSKKFEKEITENTNKSLQEGVTGLPAVYIDGQSSGTGFQGGWDGLELMLKAGGVN